MNFSLGGGKRAAIAAAAAMTLTFSLAACSGSDEPSPLDEPTASATSATPTPDQAAADQAAVVALVDRYWAASTAAENAGDDSGKQFDGIAQGTFIEDTLKSIRDAKADGVTRTGAPTVTDVEVSVTGDTADIRACLDEDGWRFVKDGADLGFEKRGAKPWGAEATRSGDGWTISDVRLPPEGEKSCS